jgi:heme oxygenase (biliverdin-IX-beta and delta-forming)
MLLGKIYDPAVLPDYPSRRKAASILTDLKTLGKVGSSTLSIPLIPEINAGFAALGAIYVLEGSTLGGKVIKELISKQLNRSSDTSFGFFDGYGENTFKMWQDFKLAIDRLLLTEQEYLQIIDTANKTFTTLKNWMQHEPAN